MLAKNVQLSTYMSLFAGLCMPGPCGRPYNAYWALLRHRALSWQPLLQNGWHSRWTPSVITAVVSKRALYPGRPCQDQDMSSMPLMTRRMRGLRRPTGHAYRAPRLGLRLGCSWPVVLRSYHHQSVPEPPCTAQHGLTWHEALLLQDAIQSLQGG